MFTSFLSRDAPLFQPCLLYSSHAELYIAFQTHTHTHTKVLLCIHLCTRFSLCLDCNQNTNNLTKAYIHLHTHTHKTAQLFIAKRVYLTFKMQFNHRSKKSVLNTGQWPSLFSFFWYIVDHIIFCVIWDRLWAPWENRKFLPYIKYFTLLLTKVGLHL